MIEFILVASLSSNSSTHDCAWYGIFETFFISINGNACRFCVVQCTFRQLTDGYAQWVLITFLCLPSYNEFLTNYIVFNDVHTCRSCILYCKKFRYTMVVAGDWCRLVVRTFFLYIHLYANCTETYRSSHCAKNDHVCRFQYTFVWLEVNRTFFFYIHSTRFYISVVHILYVSFYIQNICSNDGVAHRGNQICRYLLLYYLTTCNRESVCHNGLHNTREYVFSTDRKRLIKVPKGRKKREKWKRKSMGRRCIFFTEKNH